MENNTKKILIIEDDYAVSSAIEMKISASGFDVLTAGDGEEGLQKALTERPDLILLDIILPKMDGMTLLSKLRHDEWGATAKVIVLTNLGTGDELEKSKEGDVNEFLIKTEWSLDDVVTKIKETLEL